MSVKNRLKEYLKSRNISITAFESSINVSNGYVNSISKSIGVDKINSILENNPNLNIEWLFTGKGSMIKEPKNQLIKSVKVEDASENKLIDRLENDVLYLKQEIEKKDLIIEKKDEEIKRLNNLLIANESLPSSKTA